MINLKLIIGSTRPERAADKVIPWIENRIRQHGEFNLETLDLRDWKLPLFQEYSGSIGSPQNPTYSEPIVKSWNNKLREAEALVIVTPEYLHGMPGILKNALDNVFLSFALRNKPAGVVSYSGGIAGGSRAIENLVHVSVEAELILLRNSVMIPFVSKAFSEDSKPISPMTEAAATVMLDDLAWWSQILTKARASGELAPGSARIRAIMASK